MGMKMICSECGDEFDVTTARRQYNRLYGSGAYDDEYPDLDICGDCAIDQAKSAENSWAEIEEYMPFDWMED